MKVSLFKNGYIHIGEDLSYTPPKTEEGITTPAKGHPDCVFGGDFDFDPEKQNISINKDNFEVTIENIAIIPKTESDIKREIGDIIVREAFENNPHAQIADLTSAVVGLAYLISLSHGKQAVQQALGPLIQTINNVSDVRENMGLSRFDISFLE